MTFLLILTDFVSFFRHQIISISIIIISSFRVSFRFSLYLCHVQLYNSSGIMSSLFVDGDFFFLWLFTALSWWWLETSKKKNGERIPRRLKWMTWKSFEEARNKKKKSHWIPLERKFHSINKFIWGYNKVSWSSSISASSWHFIISSRFHFLALLIVSHIRSLFRQLHSRFSIWLLLLHKPNYKYFDFIVCFLVSPSCYV